MTYTVKVLDESGKELASIPVPDLDMGFIQAAGFSEVDAVLGYCRE